MKEKNQLTNIENKIYNLILSECLNNNICILSNEEIAKKCNCSISSVAHSISLLKKEKFIKLVKFDGRTRKLQVRVAKEN